MNQTQEQIKAARKESASGKKGEGLRFRAFLIGIPLIYLSALWIFWGEMHLYTFCTWAAPFCNAVYILLIVSLINLLLRKYIHVLSLNRLELLAIYVMVSVGSALISSDMQGVLICLMGYPTYFANDVNNWHNLFANALPDWLLVTNKSVLTGFYRGGMDFLSEPKVMMAWLKPIIPWTLFIWALYFMMLSVSTILRKAWIERERLTFPIVALPIAMTDESEEFFKNKLMWLGFAIAGGITLINGLNMLYPSVPYIAIKRWSYPIVAGGAFSNIGAFTISFYFFAIALGFLMPLDLSFSLGFFYGMFRLQPVLAQVLGVPPGSAFPYAPSQAFGAYSAIFCAAVWGLRGYLKAVWKTAFGKGDPDGDINEPIKYRTAIILFGLSSLFLVGFSIAAGMHPMVALVFFTIYLAMSVMITRIRAEFGFPVHDMHEMGAGQTLIRTFGANSFDERTNGVFSLFWWFNRVYRSHPMPHQLEGMKVAGNHGRSQRAMFKAMLIAGMIAVPICFLVYLQGFYHFGAATAKINMWGVGYGIDAFAGLEKSIKWPDQPELGDKIATIFGFAFALLLAALRRHFAGFPFHPLGFAVANSWGMYNLWLPIMIGSLCKWAVMKISGLSGYRRAVMLFFGLMLGEFAVGCTWILLGMAFDIQTYQFWP